MNTDTGALVEAGIFKAMPAAQKKNFIKVVRDLTAKETADMQIRLYAPCGCGSGKKFKFCCKTKPHAEPEYDSDGNIKGRVAGEI